MSGAPPGFLFIVSSPSGGGKTTLIRRLLTNPPGGEPLRFSVSHTTRPRREGEQNGREYHFVSAAEFEGMSRHAEFLEHNEVHGNFYGTAKSEVLPRLAAGEDVILDIDVQGARDIRAARARGDLDLHRPVLGGRARAKAAKPGARRGGCDTETAHQRRQGNRTSRVFSVCYRK